MSEPLTDSAAPPRRTWSPWRAVVGFGVVSLAADMVYEGARVDHRPAPRLARRLGAGRRRWSPAPARPPRWCCAWSSARWPTAAAATGR